MPSRQVAARPPAAAPVPGLAPRRAALRVLDAVLRRGEPLEGALNNAVRDVAPGPDRALAHAIAAAVLRWMPDLDRLIDSATRLRLADDAKARAALRLALAGRLVLGTPPHAAVSTVLPLLEGGPRRLVHGVFGTLMRSGAVLPAVPTLPHAVAERWTEAWGTDTVAAAARGLAEPPPLDLSLRDPDATADWAERLGAESLMPGHLRLAPGRAVPDLLGYSDGAWWVQDIAASIPARLIGRGTGRVLDLCAAPGGKTLQLAAAGWRVTALDRSESRLARLRDNLERTGLSAEIVAADALDWSPDVPFDAILIDAPCSATGIFRRHPDVLHRLPDLEGLADLQSRLLARAADWVRPGGTLVYATCSLEPAEGEDRVAAFVADRGDFAPMSGADDLAPGLARESDGCWRVLPGAVPGGCDGFFAARFRRQG